MYRVLHTIAPEVGVNDSQSFFSLPVSPHVVIKELRYLLILGTDFVHAGENGSRPSIGRDR